MAAIPPLPLLSTFQKHIEDMRSLVLCKICIKPLYEPYILSCGHTFCYTCLTSWFGGSGPTRKRVKKCPDCRATVTLQPAPNYVLRDLAHMFITRAELLPEDETTEDHERDGQAETAELAKDRASEGLFKGAFKSNNFLSHAMLDLGRPLLPIRDIGDGVQRCPECMWELEHGECGQCGYAVFDGSEDDYSEDDELDDDLPSELASDSDEELDHDVDAVDDDFDEARPSRRGFRNEQRILLDDLNGAREGHQNARYSEDERSDFTGDAIPAYYDRFHTESLDEFDDEHDDRDDEDLPGFVVDDSEIEMMSDTESHISHSSTASSIPMMTIHVHRHPRVVPSDSESAMSSSSGYESDSTAIQRRSRREARNVLLDFSDSMSPESEDETPVPQQQPRYSRRPLIISDDEEEKEEEDDGEGEGEGEEGNTMAQRQNFPLQDTTTRQAAGTGLHALPQGMTDQNPQEPPQSRMSRTNHLNQQRAARRGNNRADNGHSNIHGNPQRSSSVQIISSPPPARPVQVRRSGRPASNRPGSIH